MSISQQANTCSKIWIKLLDHLFKYYAEFIQKFWQQRHQNDVNWPRCDVFIVNFEHIPNKIQNIHLILSFITLSSYLPAGFLIGHTT